MARAKFHLLLLLVLHQEVVYSISLNCLPNKSCACRNTVQTVRWEIFCAVPEVINLTVDLDQYELTATVHCHEMDAWPVVEIEVLRIVGKKFAVKFYHCPWPEWPLSKMIEKTENESIDLLEINELASTMSKLTRRHFSRIPRIDGLSLTSSRVLEFSADALRDLSDLQRIQFSRNEISVLPRGIFSDLTKLEQLELNENKMQRVNSLLFENLSELKELSLSDNHLKTLEPETFKDLVSLEFLNIGNNYLTTLSEDIFKFLAKLQQLQMSGNKFVSLPQRLLVGNSRLVIVNLSENRGNLSTLPDEFFGNLTSLSQVYVSGNNFTDFPEDIFVGSPGVQRVELSRNKLSKLHEKTFKNLSSIDRIDLSNNEFNNFPDGLFQDLERLSVIDLRENAITSISRNLLSNTNTCFIAKFDSNQISEIESWSFSNLTYLSDVSLRNNKLASIPENIFWGSFALEYVDISENELTAIPVKLFRDSRILTGLNLNANNLNDLPEGVFKGLDYLLFLKLQNNAFTTLPDKILAQATSLRNLHLEFNHMTEIDLSDLRCLPSIEVASFSHNLITRIISTTNPKSELTRCTEIPKLANLALDHNNISNFLMREIDIFEKLSLLNLTDNQISSVELAGLDDINRVVTIDITRNNIEKLDIDEIPSNSQVRLHIGDNPIDCGCDVYQLRKYFVDRSRQDFNKTYVITADHLTCSRPKSMDGRAVEDLELETFECELDDSERPRICREKCDCTWRPIDDTLVANCSYRNLTTAPYTFCGFKGIAVELNLTGNFITEMPFFRESYSKKYKYNQVTKIFLSRNRIRNIALDVLPRDLSVLHLDNNDLTRFLVAVAETVRNTTSLRELTLHSNPWSCDRETREAFNISREKLVWKIGDVFNRTCLDSRKHKNGDEKPTTYITYQMF